MRLGWQEDEVTKFASLPSSPRTEKLVLSEFSERLIPISSEAWRHECEVSFLLGLPTAMQNEMLDGLPGTSGHNQHGVDKACGEGRAAMLRTEIERLVEIRRKRCRTG